MLIIFRKNKAKIAICIYLLMQKHNINIILTLKVYMLHLK